MLSLKLEVLRSPSFEELESLGLDGSPFLWTPPSRDEFLGKYAGSMCAGPFSGRAFFANEAWRGGGENSLFPFPSVLPIWLALRTKPKAVVDFPL